MLDMQYLVKGQDNAFEIEITAKGDTEAKFLTMWLIERPDFMNGGVTVSHSIFDSVN